MARLFVTTSLTLSFVEINVLTQPVNLSPGMFLCTPKPIGNHGQEHREGGAGSLSLSSRPSSLVPGLTPTNFASDFGKGHRKEDSLNAMDASNGTSFCWCLVHILPMLFFLSVKALLLTSRCFCTGIVCITMLCCAQYLHGFILQRAKDSSLPMADSTHSRPQIPPEACMDSRVHKP